MRVDDRYSDLINLAEEYESAAKRIRDAVVTLTDLPPLPGQAVREDHDDMDVVAAVVNRTADVSEAEYLDVFERQPKRGRNAAGVFKQLVEEGKTPASTNAVRTALIRLAKKGKVERVGHGVYRLAIRTEGPG